MRTETLGRSYLALPIVPVGDRLLAVPISAMGVLTDPWLAAPPGSEPKRASLSR
jgi:hypothetical protein